MQPGAATNFWALFLFPANVSLALLFGVADALACGDSPDPETVVQAQVEAYNAHNLDAFVECYAGNVTIHTFGSDESPIKGLDALREAYTWLETAPEPFGVEIAERIVNGPIVVDKERVVGVPDYTGPPEVLAIYEVRDGKILNVWFPPAR